ncbi:MAG: VWA domain-containing protein [Bacteroidales bacterium]|nr:VWA domain-containing protein [Bacteroidales bacterium]
MMQLFRFENPEMLWGLALIPLLLLAWIINGYRFEKRMRSAGENELVRMMMPFASRFRRNLKFVIQLLAFVFLIIMIARPQFGSKLEEVKVRGVEIVIALDVSNSMLAEDIRPNRLERAKQSISRMVNELRNDRIGLILFAGDAYVQLPVTTDYVSAKMFLSAINPGIVPKQGTDISSAIELASNSFSPQSDRSRAIIIITDGENHDTDPVKTATAAREKGVVIHTVGLGSSEGVPIPVPGGGGREYLKDNEGNTVITRLDDSVLRKIAIAGDGTYVRASDSSLGLGSILDEIRKMEQQEMEMRLFSEYNEQFPYLAVIALLLLISDLIVMERRNRYLSRLKLSQAGILSNNNSVDNSVK